MKGIGGVGRVERLVGVDLLRALAIVQVVAVHINNIYIPAPQGLPALIAKPHWADGVTLFFVVSGFLITRAIMLRERDLYRLSLRGFYIRRIARIQPLLLASIAFGAAMLALGFTAEPFMNQPHGRFDAAFWLSLVTFSFNWLRVAAAQNCMLNEWGMHWDVMWSLAIEEQFYLVLPIALWLAGQRNRFLLLLLAAIAVCAGQRLSAPDFSSFTGYDALGVGVLASILAPLFPARLAIAAMPLGAIILGLGVVAPELAGLRPFLVIGGAAIFILGDQAKDDVFKGVVLGPLFRIVARIGELSYELYLLHPLVLVLVAPTFFVWRLNYGMAVIYAVAIAAVFAHLVETYFTRPMNTLLRRSLLPSAALPMAAHEVRV
ncbi:MAG TPA: acyltransferase [Stellaceae bacterium]|jgi:peptidoglycan/LPS O-acetylase OafA/YrhL|nr:acyltransferase [Stellaceae bacterium]